MHVTVRIEVARIRTNAEAVRRRTGVPLLAVVKADAYGLGAAQVIAALRDLADGFCFFSFAEATAADCWRVAGRPGIVMGPPGDVPAERWRELHVRPAVATPADAEHLVAAEPVLMVDTGQQRFACPLELVDEALRRGSIREAMTHASTIEQVRRFTDIVGGRGLTLHAAGTALLDESAARLDAVRPGLALYRGAMRVGTRLVEVRDLRGPAGYTGFSVPRAGVILCGYANGLRIGPCTVNGRPSRILEVGMQSAFVECAAGDRVGDEVVLLGESVSEDAVAAAWGSPPQTVLVQLARAGERAWTR